MGDNKHRRHWRPRLRSNRHAAKGFVWNPTQKPPTQCFSKLPIIHFCVRQTTATIKSTLKFHHSHSFGQHWKYSVQKRPNVWKEMFIKCDTIAQVKSLCVSIIYLVEYAHALFKQTSSWVIVYVKRMPKHYVNTVSGGARLRWFVSLWTASTKNGASDGRRIFARQ